MDKITYTRDDFVNKAEVRWCPGCGDYAILAAFQRLLPQLGLPPEKHVVVSGIGCAGRFPYYMNTYGFHTIHGRATAVATGLKSMRDDLCVWVVTGDGDALSIGGNHLIHCLRRNVNIKILLVNNQVYGLTKGQFSPTSPKGQVTKTSPQGVSVEPMNPIMLALAAGASFVARAVDKDPNQLAAVLKAAYEHPGCALVEIYQDCHIFNDGAFDAFSLKANRSENTIALQQDKPLVYGAESQWALACQGDHFERVLSTSPNALSHDSSNFLAAMRLASLTFPDFPVPLGIYYQKPRDVFSLDGKVNKSLNDLSVLYRGKASWRQEV